LNFWIRISLQIWK